MLRGWLVGFHGRCMHWLVFSQPDKAAPPGCRWIRFSSDLFVFISQTRDRWQESCADRQAASLLNLLGMVNNPDDH